MLYRTHEASGIKARQIPTYSMRVLHHPLSCVTARTKCSVHSPECGKSREHSMGKIMGQKLGQLISKLVGNLWDIDIKNSAVSLINHTGYRLHGNTG